MIEEFLAGVVKALPGAVVSLVVSGLMLYYLRRYIDAKLAAEEQRRKEDHEIRGSVPRLEQKRRRAARPDAVLAPPRRDQAAPQRGTGGGLGYVPAGRGGPESPGPADPRGLRDWREVLSVSG